MAFCAIYGRNHDSNYPCAGFADGMLNDAGTETHPKMLKDEFKKLEKWD
jgi:hypothetical protein